MGRLSVVCATGALLLALVLSDLRVARGQVNKEEVKTKLGVHCKPGMECSTQKSPFFETANSVESELTGQSIDLNMQVGPRETLPRCDELDEGEDGVICLPKEAARRRRLMQVNERIVNCGVTEEQTESPWGLDRINQRDLPLDGSYTYNSTGSGVNVYLISTGVRATHRDFAYRDGRPGTRVVGAYSFDESDPLEDRQGFGTQAASIIGGITYGVAKDAIIHSVKVFNEDPSTNITDVLQAVDWVLENAVPPAVVVWLTYGPSSSEKDAGVARLLLQGLPVVVGAGDRDTDACGEGPANVEEAITVAATARNDAMAPGSNFGSCVDVTAPGFRIMGASAFFDDATLVDSNSNTAPAHVGGAIARLIEEEPGLTPQQMRLRLLQRSTKNRVLNPRGTPNRLLYTGEASPKCPGFSPIGTAREINLELQTLDCVEPNGFPSTDSIPQNNLIYIELILTSSNGLSSSAVTANSFETNIGTVTILSVEARDPDDLECSGYLVKGVLPQPNAFSVQSEEICLEVAPGAIRDFCGLPFPGAQACMQYDYCPEINLCAAGMGYSSEYRHVRTNKNSNLVMLASSEPVPNITSSNIACNGPEPCNVEIFTSMNTPEIIEVVVESPPDYAGDVTVAVMGEVVDAQGRPATPSTALTYEQVPEADPEYHVCNHAFTFNVPSLSRR